MKSHVLIASAIVFASLSTGAMALTVTNADDAAYQIAVTKTDGSSQTIELAAKGSTEVDCATGCVLALNDQQINVDPAMTAVTVSDGKFSK